MIRTTRIAILSAALCLLAAGAAHAADQKIGYVDSDRILKESAYLQGMIGAVEQEMDAMRTRIDEWEKEYSNLSLELRRKESVLSQNEVDAMRKRLRDLRNQIQDEEYDLQRTMTRAQREQMDPAVDKVLETIRKIGDEEDFDLILRGEVVLYGKETLDVTDRVIRRLDSENKAPAGTEDAAAPETGDAKAPALSRD